MIGCTENMSPLSRNREKKISHSAHLSSDLGRHRRNYLVILVTTMMTHYIKEENKRLKVIHHWSNQRNQTKHLYRILKLFLLNDLNASG
jgi:hypothetical protein